MFWNICLWIYEFSAFCVALLILSGNIKGVKLLKEKAKRENRTVEFKGNFSTLFSGIITNCAMISSPCWILSAPSLLSFSMIDLSMELKQKLRIINSLRTMKRNNSNWKKILLCGQGYFFIAEGGSPGSSRCEIILYRAPHILSRGKLHKNKWKDFPTFVHLDGCNWLLDVIQ